MSKFITHFQTEAAYQAALPSLDLPNVSLVDELGEVHYHRALYGAHAGDICLYDVAEGQKFFVTKDDWNLTSYPTASYPIVGIAVADEGASGVYVMNTKPVTDSGEVSGTSTDYEPLFLYSAAGTTYLGVATQNTYASVFNGKEVTYNLYNNTKDSSTDYSHTAIFSAVKFSKTGTTVGDWFVPSSGELNYLVTNYTYIKNSFDKIISADSSLANIAPGSNGRKFGWYFNSCTLKLNDLGAKTSDRWYYQGEVNSVGSMKSSMGNYGYSTDTWCYPFLKLT